MTGDDQAARLARLAPAPELWHARQLGPTGCIYHAAYALLGDSALLDHVQDVGTGAWIARLAQRGVVPYHLYATRQDPEGVPLSVRGWEAVRSQAQLRRETVLSLLLTVDSTRYQGTHLVAAHISHRALDTVRISDSVRPGIQDFTWAAFLASPYARAWEVEQLVSLDLTRYAPEYYEPVPLEIL